MKPILNISAYKFVALSDTARWRESIRLQARGDSLRGTVLLADEGINLCVAGLREDALRFAGWLRSHAQFADLALKQSESDEVPFGKLLVKVKREIIRMNRPGIRPHVQRAPGVEAQTLARWLDSGVDDAGRKVVTLDTRNAFEVDHGRFRGALDWRIERFSDFPRAFETHRSALAGKTVVSYCTGGIRCEKAALWMAQAGLENVLQLEGGILRYFEQTGGRHFDGACFVFDERALLNDSLAPMRQV